MHYSEEVASVGLVSPLHSRNIPILGWVMEKAGFCFLDRDWKKDQSNIDIFWNSCFSDTATHRMLIMFPEGTTRDVSTLHHPISRRFAKAESRLGRQHESPAAAIPASSSLHRPLRPRQASSHRRHRKGLRKLHLRLHHAIFDLFRRSSRLLRRESPARRGRSGNQVLFVSGSHGES